MLRLIDTLAEVNPNPATTKPDRERARQPSILCWRGLQARGGQISRLEGFSFGAAGIC